MYNLLAFLVKYYHWLIFLALEIISGVLLFKYNSYQGSVWISAWISSSNAVAGTVQYFTLKQANEELTSRNIILEQRIWQMRQQLDSLSAVEDTSSVLARYDASTLIQAKVISNSVNKKDNLITINRGRLDGVHSDMAVVCGRGVVGVVYLASDHYAVVLPVLNSHSHISCCIRNRDYFGYLIWDGGDASIAYLEDVPRHAVFDVGEWVETSGFSAIFPPGVSVGRIVEIDNSPDGLSYRVKVHLSTDFGCLRDVCVINDPSIVELVRLESEAVNSLSIKKK